MKRECGECIHSEPDDRVHLSGVGAMFYCLKHLEYVNNPCDDFWPPNPTCAECRFATVSRDPAYAKQTGHVYCTFKDDHRYCDLFCPAWRCRVQS